MNDQTIKLTAVVEAVKFAKKSDGGRTWYSLATSIGSCAGCLSFEPVPGDRLELHGRWGEFGGRPEFKFHLAQPDVPEDARMLLHYVCERTPGIGARKEEAIWETLGSRWPEIQPGQVRGINDSVLNDFLDNYRDILLHDEMYKTVAWLRSLGASPRMAELAFERWKLETPGVVKTDCFRLTELTGIGFKSVDDTVRIGLGIADDDPRRIRACLLYAIETCATAAGGSTLVDFNAVLNEAQKLLRTDLPVLYAAAGRLAAERKLLVFAGEQVAPAADFEHEKTIWEFAGNGTEH